MAVKEYDEADVVEQYGSMKATHSSMERGRAMP
jgi:hypothetical protein